MSKFDNDFQKQMEAQLIAFKEQEQYLPSSSEKKRIFYSEFSDNLYPPIRHGFLQYMCEKGMPLHDFINHVRSSQAYCINLLFPLIKQHEEKLLEQLGRKTGKKLVKIERFEFEYSPEENILGEWKSDSNRPEEYVTAIDVRLDCVELGANKAGVTFLFEVKFTESGFSECGGYNSRGNQRDLRAACERSNLLIDDFKKCYLNGGKLQRIYFTESFNPHDSFKHGYFNDECPFRDNHQCLRIHALAKKMSAEQQVYLVLVHHENNEEILKKWKSYVNMLNSNEDLFSISGKELVAISENATLQRYYKDRYELKDRRE